MGNQDKQSYGQSDLREIGKTEAEELEMDVNDVKPISDNHKEMREDIQGGKMGYYRIMSQ